MSAFAIIPARGGSKRIPRKNIRPFLGKPMIAYSIETAFESGIFDEVIVSTDDEEIASVAEQYGASSPFVRPAEIADNQTGIIEVIAHAIQELEKQGKSPDFICTIYATAPLMQYHDLIEAYRKLQDSDKGFIVAATTFPATIFRSFAVQKNGAIKMFWPENYPANSQDLPEAYHDAGQFLWGRRNAYLQKPVQVFSDQSIAFPIPRHRVMDIDSLEDWGHAEVLYKVLQMAE